MSATSGEPNIVERLRRAGQSHAALQFVLGVELAPDRTTAVKCPEPRHHKNGDVSPSGIACPQALQVRCAVTGEVWGLLDLGVLGGVGATPGAVAKALEERFLGPDHTSRAPASRVDSGAEKSWPYYPRTAASLGWEVDTSNDGRRYIRATTWLPDGSAGRVKIRREKVPGRKDTASFEADEGRAIGWLNGNNALAAIRSAGDGSATVALLAGETDLLAWTHHATAEGIAVTGISAATGETAKLKPVDAPLFDGAHVIVIYDNDDVGRAHGPLRADETRALGAKSAVSIHVPDGHKDVCDYLRAGGTVRKLVNQADAARSRKPAATAARTPAAASPSVTPWTRFPTECLPYVARLFVEEAAKSIGCDPAFVALPALSAMAAAIGNSRRALPKPGWAEPSVLWTLVIGDSGTQKTPAFKAALEPTKSLQNEAMVDHRERVRQAERDCADVDSVSPPERFLVDDITMEALAARLAHAPRGLLLAKDELAGWFKGFDAYRKGKGADEAKWLEIHGAGSIVVDRKHGSPPTVSVPRAAVSITGTTQPATARALLGERDFGSGLVARFLLAWPPRRRRRWSEATVSDTVRERYKDLIASLMRLTPREAGLDPSDPWVPRDLRLTSEARELWVDFYNRNAEAQSNAEGSEGWAYSKIEGGVLRLALVIQCARSVSGGVPDGGDQIDAESMRNAITLGDWFAEEALRVYARLRATEDDERTNGLLEWIHQQGGRVTVRDLARGPRRFRGQESEAEAALEELVQRGDAFWEDVPPTLAGGRPTRRAVLTRPPEENPGGDSLATEPVEAERAERAAVPSPNPGDGSADRESPATPGSESEVGDAH